MVCQKSLQVKFLALGRPAGMASVTIKDATLVRQRLLDQVFQPGHNLPSMTLDEVVEKEIADGRIILPKEYSSVSCD